MDIVLFNIRVVSVDSVDIIKRRYHYAMVGSSIIAIIVRTDDVKVCFWCCPAWSQSQYRLAIFVKIHFGSPTVQCSTRYNGSLAIDLVILWITLGFIIVYVDTLDSIIGKHTLK